MGLELATEMPGGYIYVDLTGYIDILYSNTLVIPSIKKFLKSL